MRLARAHRLGGQRRVSLPMCEKRAGQTPRFRGSSSNLLTVVQTDHLAKARGLTDKRDDADVDATRSVVYAWAKVTNDVAAHG